MEVGDREMGDEMVGSGTVLTVTLQSRLVAIVQALPLPIDAIVCSLKFSFSSNIIPKYL